MTTEVGGRLSAAERIVVATAAALAVFHTVYVIAFTLRHSHYVGDDVVAFYQARTVPFLRHFMTPIDVHQVPLHRVASYALAWLAPMNFRAGTALLAVFHVASLVCLYRALRVLCPSAPAAVATAWYAMHVHLVSLFSFWTAGLHRLPYIAFLAAALLGYARYRREPSPKNAAIVLGSAVAALGFFEKGALVLPTLAAVEVCLWPETTASTRRASMKLFAVLAVLTLVYFAAWRLLAGPVFGSLSFDPKFLLAHTRLSWVLLLRSAVGHTYTDSVAGIWFAAAIVAVTVALRPWNAVVWAVGFLTVSGHLAISGISSFRNAWNLLLAGFSHRYYPETFVVFVVFFAIACHFAAGTRLARVQALLSGSGRWAPALLAVGLMLWISWSSIRGIRANEGYFYSVPTKIMRYRDRVESGIRALRARHLPLVFVDGNVPGFVDAFGLWSAKHSVMLTAMGVEARFAPPGPGVYEILSDGGIIPSGTLK